MARPNRDDAGDSLAVVPAGTEEIRTSVASDRNLREKILKARLTWAMFGQDADKTEQALDLEPGSVETWRQTRAPDGRDWDNFVEEMGLADSDQVFEIVGPQDEFGFSGDIIRQAQRLINVCMTVLNEGALFDAEGNEVKYLYDFEKRRVPVGGLRPKSFGEAAQGVRWLTSVVQETFERIRQLSDWESKSQRDRDELVRQVTTTVRRAFGEEGLQRFLTVAAGVGLQDAPLGPPPEVLEIRVTDHHPPAEKGPVAGDTILF